MPTLPQIRRSVAVVASVVALAAGVVVGLQVHELQQPTVERQKQSAAVSLPSAKDFDSGSIAYVGSYVATNFWSASRGGGQVCLIAIHGTRKQIACAAAAPAGDAHVEYGTADPGGQQNFLLTVFPDGRSEFVVKSNPGPLRRT